MAEHKHGSSTGKLPRATGRNSGALYFDSIGKCLQVFAVLTCSVAACTSCLALAECCVAQHNTGHLVGSRIKLGLVGLTDKQVQSQSAMKTRVCMVDTKDTADSILCVCTINSMLYYAESSLRTA